MDMPMQDVFDRLTICVMKAQYDNGAALERDIAFAEVSKALGFRGEPSLLLNLLRLAAANGRGWEAEHNLKMATNHSPMDYELIGEIAMGIRAINDVRMEAKDVIKELMGRDRPSA